MSAGDFQSTVRLMQRAGVCLILIQVLYAIVTAIGFLTLENADQPISDPWFAGMEWLIIMLAVPVLFFHTALIDFTHAKRAWASLALVFAAMTFCLSASLHAVILAIGRDHSLVAAGSLLSFTWPSAAYAIDIVAWDGFFAVASLCTGIALREFLPMRWASKTFIVAGIASFAGLAGPLIGYMPIRAVSIIGYAIGYPIAVLLVLRAVARDTSAQKS